MSRRRPGWPLLSCGPNSSGKRGNSWRKPTALYAALSRTGLQLPLHYLVDGGEVVAGLAGYSQDSLELLRRRRILIAAALRNHGQHGWPRGGPLHQLFQAFSIADIGHHQVIFSPLQRFVELRAIL